MSENIDICLNNCKHNEVDAINYFGVCIDIALTWSDQLSSICVKVFLPRDVLLKIYKRAIVPILDYSVTV